MKPQEIKLYIEPSKNSLFTKMHLCGEIMTSIHPTEFAKIVDVLSRWSDGPIELVLSADCRDGQWFDWWASNIDLIPHDHLEVRFTINQSENSIIKSRAKKPLTTQNHVRFFGGKDENISGEGD